jgi:hypothetical protein
MDRDAPAARKIFEQDLWSHTPSSINAYANALLRIGDSV